MALADLQRLYRAALQQPTVEFRQTATQQIMCPIPPSFTPCPPPPPGPRLF
jgi:hypothetical protein